MSSLRIIVIVVIAVALNLCESRVIFSFLSASVSRNRYSPQRSRKSVRADDPPTLYDEYGSIPQVQNCYKAIAQAKPVVIFRRASATVVGFERKRSHNSLQVDGAFDPIHVVSLPFGRHKIKNYLVLTGVVGDCRTIVQYVKQIALNHTIEFEAAPSPEFLATSLGEFMQSYLSGAGRMLAAHCFIISTGLPVQYEPSFANRDNIDSQMSQGRRTPSAVSTKAGVIYEVTAVGGADKVLAGVVGGHHAAAAKRALRENYRPQIDESASQSLVKRVLYLASRGDKPDPEELEDEKVTEESIDVQYIELADTL